MLRVRSMTSVDQVPQARELAERTQLGRLHRQEDACGYTVSSVVGEERGKHRRAIGTEIAAAREVDVPRRSAMDSEDRCERLEEGLQIGSRVIYVEVDD